MRDGLVYGDAGCAAAGFRVPGKVEREEGLVIEVASHNAGRRSPLVHLGMGEVVEGWDALKHADRGIGHDMDTEYGEYGRRERVEVEGKWGTCGGGNWSWMWGRFYRHAPVTFK
ncbi:MAG TPA: hypothetical protein VGO47_08175 [Chlamydiales bacterium]|nr:hypothetical protein [Chlamydiales bacterium]